MLGMFFFSKSIPGLEDFFWETFLWAWYQRVHICWNGFVLVTGRNPLWQPHWKLLWSKVPPPQIDQIESGMPPLSKYIMHNSTYITSQHSFDPICFYVWNLWPSNSKSQVDWLQHLQRPVVRFGLFSAESPSLSDVHQVVTTEGGDWFNLGRSQIYWEWIAVGYSYEKYWIDIY